MLDQRLDDFENGRVLGDVCDSQLQIPLLQLFDRAIAFGKSSTEGLFHVDVTTRLSRRNDHVVMLVDPSRTNGNHVEFFLREHFAKVRIDFLGVRPFLSGRAPFWVLVGKRDNVNIRQFRESDIDAVSIVTFTRAANDSHSNALASCGSDGTAELRSQNSRSDGYRTIVQKLASGSSLHRDSPHEGLKGVSNGTRGVNSECPAK